MSPAFSTRRHADAFDRLVEAARQGTPASGPVPADLVDLASFATGLREATPAVTPRPSFSADLRERLMAAAATELVPAADVTDRLTVRSNPMVRRRHERRLTIGIASLAIVGASAGTALASQGALPGEPLYPVKRAIENVRTGFTPSEQGKGSALLADAHTRLGEAAKLSHDDSASGDEIQETLKTFTEQAKKASDLLLSNYQEHDDSASIDKLQTFTATSIDQLTVLAPLVPDAAKQALTDAAQAVLTIDAAVHNACPDCGGSPITSLPESLLDPVASTLGTLTSPLSGAKQKTTGNDQQVKLPTVPVDLGPANVAPTKPAVPLQTPTGAPTSKPTSSTKPLLPPPPSAPPTSLNDAVKDVTEGVTGTVGGVLGTVNGVLGGLLGVKTPAP